MNKELIELIEYAPPFVIDYRLNDEERRYLSNLSIIEKSNSRDFRFYFDELHSGLRIKPLNWVGVIELANVRIVIKPKFNREFHSLVKLICFIERLPYFVYHDTKIEDGKNDLIELLVRLYLLEVARLLKVGVSKEYINISDNLNILKGRVDFIKNAQLNFANPASLYCNYDELSTNIIENQIIHAALSKSRQFRLKDSTKKKVDIYLHEFQLICEEYIGDTMPIFSYNRLNSHYERVHRLTKYILKQKTLKDFYSYSNSGFYSVLMDMNELFEMFVYTLFVKYLPDNYNVQKHGRRITDAIQQNSVRYKDIIPDILITDKETGEVTVIDTKYKNYGNNKVSNEDIYQLAFYAQYYHKKAYTQYRSLIIYPEYSQQNHTQDIDLELLSKSLHPGTLGVRSISIEYFLNLIFSKSDDEIRSNLVKLIS